MPTRLLLTGANGYLGARCLDHWSRDTGLEVLAVRHARVDRELQVIPAHIHYATCDLGDAAAVDELCERWSPQVIVHAAVALPDGQPGYLGRAIRANVAATANLAAAGAAFGCERFLYCSSISVYGTPPASPNGWEESEPVTSNSDYGWTKFAGEEVLRLSAQSSMRAWSLRLSGLHGPGRKAGALYHFVRAVLQGRAPTASPSMNRFQFAFVDDVVDVLRQAVHWESSSSVNVVNVATVTMPTLATLAMEIAELLGARPDVTQGAPDHSAEAVMNLQRLATRWTPSVDQRTRLLEFSEWVRSSH